MKVHSLVSVLALMSLLAASSSLAQSFEVEPNNNIGQATGLKDAQWMSGQLISATDVDFFYYETDKAGALNIVFEPADFGLYAKYYDLSVFSTDGTLQARYTEISRKFVQSVSMAKPGRYSISVSAAASRTYDWSDKQYRITCTYDPLITTIVSRLTNISTLAFVAPGQAVVAGFVINGTTTKNVLVRAIGPSLKNFGVSNAVSDPKLTVFNQQGTQIAINDDWSSNLSSNSSAFQAAGAFSLPTLSLDSSVALTLQPGSYTAQVVGVNNASGAVLVEVYELP